MSTLRYCCDELLMIKCNGVSLMTSDTAVIVDPTYLRPVSRPGLSIFFRVTPLAKCSTLLAGWTGERGVQH